jgi:hypothetical protein
MPANFLTGIGLWRWVVGVMPAMLVAGCVGPSRVYTTTKPFRVGGCEKVMKMGSMSNSDAPVWVDENSSKPYMGFVEVDDHGELVSLEQLKTVATAVENVAQRSKHFHLIVFAHGWENNASPYNEKHGNLMNFAKVIKAIREDPAYVKAGVEVMGVYVGWRGKTIGVQLPPPLGFPTKVDFYHGMARAERVGKGVGITHALYELSGSARKHKPETSRVVFVGHSFGAIVIENAINKAMAGDLIKVATKGSNEKVVPPADLILLVNSAQTSIISKQTVDMLRTLKREKNFSFKVDGEVSDHEVPLIVSVTSAGDKATRCWFPTGILVGRYVTRFGNTGVAGHYRHDYKKSGYTKTQNYTHRHTAGHNRGLFSHTVVESSESSAGTAEAVYKKRYPTKAGTSDLVMAISSNQHYRRNIRRDGSILIRGVKKDYVMKAEDGLSTYNQTPFWITQVPQSMVKGHGGIWTPEFAGFATSMLHLTLVPPQQRRSPAVGPAPMDLEAAEPVESMSALPQIYFQRF